MRLSAKADYAVRAALQLAAAADGPVKGETIAEAQDIPLRFLENILAELRHGLAHRDRVDLGIGRAYAHMLALFFRGEDPVVPDTRAYFVDPGVLDDSKHPAVQSGSGLPLIRAGQRTLDGDLY